MPNSRSENPAELAGTPAGDDMPHAAKPIIELILLRPREDSRAYIRSPRLAHPEDAAAFVKQVTLE